MGFVWLDSQETNAFTGGQITYFTQWSDNSDAPGISLTALVWFVLLFTLSWALMETKAWNCRSRDKLWIRFCVFWGKDNSILGFHFHFHLVWFFLKVKVQFLPPEYPHLLSKLLSIVIDLKTYWLIISLNKISLYLLGFWKWF